MIDSERDRLSQITTDWQGIFASRSHESEAVLAAQQTLVLRYCGAVYHYLFSATQDVHAADDLAQEFALRFIRGDLRRADPKKGRFRDYVKTILYHLVADYFRLKQRQPRPMPCEELLPHDLTQEASTNAVFLRYWRQEILNRTWRELQQSDLTDSFAVLRWKSNFPDGRSSEGARDLTKQLRREITPAGFRQMLHRAREKFAELLIQEVASTLASDDSAVVQEELGELELLEYCRPFLKDTQAAAE